MPLSEVNTMKVLLIKGSCVRASFTVDNVCTRSLTISSTDCRVLRRLRYKLVRLEISVEETRGLSRTHCGLSETSASLKDEGLGSALLENMPACRGAK